MAGNIGSNRNAQGTEDARSYLTSTIQGEDRRAPTNTLDETVWATLSRDLLAVWEKMRQVLYPKYLLGGLLASGRGLGGNEGTEGDGQAGGANGLREIVGRWPDTVLQGGMSEGLRDWDLWYVHHTPSRPREADISPRGPLLFCLLLSFLLSLRAQDSQRSGVFSGVFAIIWIGEAVVTLQIKLLGGSM